MSKLVPIILSGGAGTRLWPVSRQAYPKPFMRMADGQTLAEKTLRRALEVCDGGDILTVTGGDYYFIAQEQYQRIEGIAANRLHYLLEPIGRNTAPAIAMAALFVAERWGADTQLLVMPADHLIQAQTQFLEAVQQAKRLAEAGHLVTFGIQPTHAETGYGYIHKGEPLSKDGHAIARFVEKPDLATAQTYLESDQYSWNSGMFCFSARALWQALVELQPTIRKQAEQCWSMADPRTTPLRLDKDTFGAMPNISIDYAVMEKAKNIAVVAGDFGWSDVGTWQAMSELTSADDKGNKFNGNTLLIDTHDCYIHSEQRLVATVGVDDLVIVDTADALLIAQRDRTQDVKTVVDRLRERNDETNIHHRTVHRPWGSYTILEDADDCKVKRLVVKPGQVLSLQKHQRRSEHWTVVQGTAKVRIGDDETILERNQSAYIPTDTLHRLENPTDTDIALIEVQCGDYFGEDDIERFEDVYGRI